MPPDLHISDAHALIREASRQDRSLTERQLRHFHMHRICHFLSKHTGLPFETVVEIYEQECKREIRQHLENERG